MHLPALGRVECGCDRPVGSEEARADQAAFVGRVLRQRLETERVAPEERLLRVVREVLDERAPVPLDSRFERGPLVLGRHPGKGHAGHDQDRNHERTEFDLK